MKISEMAWTKTIFATGMAVFGMALATAFVPAQTHAQHDIAPPNWCPGGGSLTGWGGYCDGRTFPDGTKWHQDSFWAPFVGRVWNPIVCVRADAPAPPPLAPGGCGGEG